MNPGMSIAFWFGALLPLCACQSPAREAAAPFRVVQADFRGEIWSDAMARAKVLFQDGAIPIAVPGGVVWAFGDTFLGERQADGKPKFNGAQSATLALWKIGAAVVPPALEYRVDANGMACTPFEFLAGESWEKNRIWPLGGIYLNNRFYLYYALIELTDAAPPWNFRSVGGGLARASEPLGKYERLRHGPNGSRGRWGLGQYDANAWPYDDWRFPLAPSQVLQVENWLYLYEAGEIGGKKGVVLGRVPVEQIENSAAYEFYAGAGPRFSRDRADAKLLTPDVYGQVSIAWNEYLGQYLMATSSDFFHPHEIQFRVAAAPAGPWSEPVARVAVPAQPGKTTQLIYCTYLHPEFFEQNGRRVCVTFCRMLAGQWELTNPEMAFIELEKTPSAKGKTP